jgi:hypothetical protein
MAEHQQGREDAGWSPDAQAGRQITSSVLAFAPHKQIVLAGERSLLDTAAMIFATPLPIDAILDELRDALAAHTWAVPTARAKPRGT